MLHLIYWTPNWWVSCRVSKHHYLACTSNDSGNQWSKLSFFFMFELNAQEDYKCFVVDEGCLGQNVGVASFALQLSFDSAEGNKRDVFSCPLKSNGFPLKWQEVFLITLSSTPALCGTTWVQERREKIAVL